MNIRRIRQHQRFALRRKVLATRGRGRPAEGLLVELSLHGCRVSNLGHDRFALGSEVSVCLPGFEPLAGLVRWSQGGTIGLRFARPLAAGALAAMLSAARQPLSELAPELTPVLACA